MPTIEIVTNPSGMIVGERNYACGDRWDAQPHLRNGHLTELQVHGLSQQRYFGPLTRESYAIAMARHPEGHVGKGFTRAELVELGILDPAAKKEAAPPAKAKPPAKSKDSPKAALEPEVYKGYVIHAVKQGNFTRFEPMTQDGQLLRLERFMKIEKARTFIDDLVATRDSAKPAAQNPPEQANDLHLRSDAEHAS